MALEIKGLEKKFLQGVRIVSAVKKISLSVPDGAFISIIGKSGSGKTTLLNLIAGLLVPTEGEILLDGRNITMLSDEEASFLRNTQIGYVMQGKSLLGNLSVLENVLLPFYLFEREGDATSRAKALLDQVGILHLAGAYPSALSGGELKRVAIARALINSPKVLLADEPTGDLDAENTREIMRLFRKIADKGTTVIMVTHELDTVKYSDVTYRMDFGVLDVYKAVSIA